MDGDWQIGHKTAEEYGRIASETAKVMKMTDRSAELVLCGSSGYGKDTFGAWEETVLDLAYDKVEYISLHQYFGNAENDVPNFLAKSMELDRFINNVIASCDHIKGKKKSKRTINLSLDEWNVWYHSHGAQFEKWSEAPHILEDIYDFADVLVVGSMLMSILRRSDRVKIACMAQLVNVIAPIMTENGGPAWEQTIFFPYMHVSRYGRGTALLPVVNSSKHDTTHFTDVPDIDTMAVLNEENGELTVFAVNRDMTDSIPLELKLLDFDGYKPVEHIEMSGYDLKQVNTAGKVTVVPHAGELPVCDGKNLTAMLKPLSWNVIRLKK